HRPTEAVEERDRIAVVRAPRQSGQVCAESLGRGDVDEASAGLGGRAAEAHVDIERDLDVPGERLAIEVLDELIRQLPLLELTHPDSGVQKHAPPVLQANDEMDVVLPAGLQKRMADVAEIDEEPCAAPGLVDDQLGTV